MSNRDVDLNNLAELLYRLSNTKNTAIFRQFAVNKPIPKFGEVFKTPLYKPKPTIIDHLEKSHYKGSILDFFCTTTLGFFDTATVDFFDTTYTTTSPSNTKFFSYFCKKSLEINPLFLCYFDAEQHFLRLDFFQLPSNNPNLLDEMNYRLNSSLIYLYQKVHQSSIKQQAIQFYRTVDLRNKSIKKLVNYSADKRISFSEATFTLDSSAKFDSDFDEMTIYRKGIITHLRNRFKDSGILKNCKYVWKINIDGFGNLVLKMIIISSAEEATFSEFKETWDEKLREYVEKNNWDKLKLSTADVVLIDKVELVNGLLEKPIIIMKDPKNHKKSVFGLGGLGGRKYK